MSEVVRKRALDEDSTSQEGEEGRDSSDHSSKRVAMDVAPQHDVQDVMVMKLLCPSIIVGAIIGRGGSVLHGFQSATNTTIRISQNNEYFPETSDRVVAMTGQPDNVKAALTSVIDRMCESILSNDAMPAPSDPRHPLCVRLLIPHAASGVVIGRGGSNIKETSTLTDTRMQLSDSVDPFNTKERIVSISGAAAENIKNAAVIVLEELLDNRTVGNFVNVTPTYHIPVMSSQHSRPQPPPMSHVGMGGNAPHHMQYAPPPSAPGAAPPYTSPYGPSGNAPPAVMTQIGVPDQLVGVIVGKGGNVLRSIIANSGASIKVSQKGDFIAGTTNRSITIEGSQQQVNFAHAEIMTCISNHEAKNAY